MTNANWCIFIAFLLPYVWIAIAKAGAYGDSNQHPRVHLEQLTDWRRRAHWAHLNAFEAFPAFAAAIILAQLIKAIPQSNIDLLANAFIAFRLAHGFLYMTNNYLWRSAVWYGGFACVITLFLLSAGIFKSLVLS